MIAGQFRRRLAAAALLSLPLVLARDIGDIGAHEPFASKAAVVDVRAFLLASDAEAGQGPPQNPPEDSRDRHDDSPSFEPQGANATSLGYYSVLSTGKTAAKLVWPQLYAFPYRGPLTLTQEKS
jgi:hypothetical protein